MNISLVAGCEAARVKPTKLNANACTSADSHTDSCQYGLRPGTNSFPIELGNLPHL